MPYQDDLLFRQQNYKEILYLQKNILVFAIFNKESKNCPPDSG